MISKLEDMLLRCSGSRARVRAYLFRHIDTHSLRTLRIVSRILHDLVDHDPYRTFGQLFVSAPWPESRNIGSLKSVAPFCRTLRIKVGHSDSSEEQRSHRILEKRRPLSHQNGHHDQKLSARERWRRVRKALTISTSSSKSSTNTSSPKDRTSSGALSTRSSGRPQPHEPSDSSAQFEWMSILARCKELQNVIIDAHGDPGWPGRAEVEVSLVAVRVALESIQLPRIHILRLAPIHAMGIVHLRWSGLGAFGTAPAHAYSSWQNLHTLDVQLYNPFIAKHHLSESQQVTFKKILHDYLRSFSQTLKTLHFVWIDHDGPSPITLDLEPALKGQREAIVWTALQEVWLGNITFPHRTIILLPERVMQAGVRLRTLRSTHRYSRQPFDDEKAWVEVLLDSAPHGIRQERVFSQASSVYSQ